MNEAKTILVVDDDRDLRTGLQTMLQQHGYRTLTADDGWEARQLIDGEHPDLVILDMMMPRWGGFVVLEHYQGKEEAPPFIMITANEGKKHQVYAEQIGAVDYIHKPFPMERLLEGVEKALGVSAPVGAAPAVVRCRCRHCGARIKAPVAMLGQNRDCPGCHKPFIVAPQAPEDAGPMLIIPESKPTPRQAW